MPDRRPELVEIAIADVTPGMTLRIGLDNLVVQHIAPCALAGRVSMVMRKVLDGGALGFRQTKYFDRRDPVVQVRPPTEDRP